ncbi:MAG: endonuclease [Paludibacteraceae bacterium]|nr:endonuclease [Paludibacteraceae bacterium]
MRKVFTLFLCLLCGGWLLAADIDMQIHWGTTDAQLKSMSTAGKQKKYYTGDYSPENLRALSGNELFGALNTLMGNTCKLLESGYDYNALRYAYVSVDKDLNKSGNIIGYYDGQSMNGTWDAGVTYNREHTWPQSKGADKDTPMGYDMQSVRPANAAINSSRGSKAYGEGSQFYDPNEIAINNSLYAPEHLGSYRGDCARVILYDYVVYGEAGGHKNDFYLGNAQLLNKLGKSGIFESVAVLLKWHMLDPSSLTEMVRNDGAQTYQGNRNPFIDYPELAIQMLKDKVTTYQVSVTGAEMWPLYSLTLANGFIAYMGTKTSRPAEVTVTGATSTYDKTSGRLTVTNVKGAVSISVASPQALEMTEDGQKAIKTIHNGQIVIIKNGKAYSILGAPIGDIR